LGGIVCGFEDGRFNIVVTDGLQLDAVLKMLQISGLKRASPARSQAGKRKILENGLS